MYTEEAPEQKPSIWDQTKYMVGIFGVAFILVVIYAIHRLWLRAQFRRAEQEHPHASRERNWFTAVYPNIGLQALQQAHVRRHGSDVTLPAPPYTRHTRDQRLPESVELEQRGKYQYLATAEDPPEYEHREGQRR